MTATAETLVLGAGYGGLICATRLGARRGSRTRRTVVLSQDTAFVERLRLHEDLARAAQAPRRALNLAPFLGSLNVGLVQGTAVSIDRAAQSVTFTNAYGTSVLGYRRLVVACGSQNAIDKTPGVREHAYRMERRGALGGEALRERLGVLGSGAHRFTVVGAGPTGVEVAAELSQVRGASVTLLTAGQFGDFTTARVRRHLRRQLQALKVEIVEDARVTAVEQRAVELADRQIAHELCVWCGGFEVPRFIAEAGLATDGQGRVLTDAWLRSVTDRRIYAVGDACQPTYITGAPPRMSAFFALATGAYVADALWAERRRREIKSFSFATYGQAIQVGRGGVGFATFPFDRPVGPIYRGRLAFRLRAFFVGLLFRLLVWARRFPRMPFWLPAPGVRRIRRPAREKQA